MHLVSAKIDYSFSLPKPGRIYKTFINMSEYKNIGTHSELTKEKVMCTKIYI